MVRAQLMLLLLLLLAAATTSKREFSQLVVDDDIIIVIRMPCYTSADAVINQQYIYVYTYISTSPSSWR